MGTEIHEGYLILGQLGAHTPTSFAHTCQKTEAKNYILLGRIVGTVGIVFWEHGRYRGDLSGGVWGHSFDEGS
jgi:hypothetical protein